MSNRSFCSYPYRVLRGYATGTRAGSGNANVGSAPSVQPVGDPSSSSGSQPGDPSLGPEDGSGAQPDNSTPGDEPIAKPVSKPFRTDPSTEPVGVNPLVHGSALSHLQSSASPSEQSSAIATTPPSSTFAHIAQTYSSASNIHTKSTTSAPAETTLTPSATLAQVAQPPPSSSSSSSITSLPPHPLVTRVPSAASKSPKNEAAVIVPLAVAALLLILAALFFFRRHRKLLLDKHQDTENVPVLTRESVLGSCRGSLPISIPMSLPNPHPSEHQVFLMSNSLRSKSRISLPMIQTEVPSGAWEGGHQWVITNRTPTPSPVKEKNFP